MSDRYLKTVLTAIALELLWLGVWAWSRPVNAQPAAMPVVITGIRIDPASETSLPVIVDGTVLIEAPGALKIQADEPLPVKAVPYIPAIRPGD